MRKMLCLLAGILALAMLSGTAQAAWWNTDYSRCKVVTLNISVGNFTNYTAKVNVTYDSDMQSDFDDIRFISGASCENGTSSLGQYLVNKTDSQFANYEVMLPAINTTVLMYYGNSSVLSYSNRRDANLFYDNFSEAGINTTLWYRNMTNGTTAIHNDYLSIQSGATTDAGERYCTNRTWPTPLAVEFDFATQVTADPVRTSEIAFFFQNSTVAWYLAVVSIYENAGWKATIYNTNITADSAYSNNTWYHEKVTGTSSIVSIYTNVTGSMVSKSSATTGLNTPSPICPQAFYPSGGWQQSHMHYDNFVVYTYSAAALSYSFGIEQQSGLDTTPPISSLISPANNNITNSSTAAIMTFNCSASDESNLANITLYGNWSAWHANETQDKSGLWNFSIFSKTLGLGAYVWNCYACDNASNCAFGTNRTLTIRPLADPVINITSPLNKSYDIWNATAKSFDDLALVISVTNDTAVSTFVRSLDGGQNVTFINGASFIPGSMRHNLTVCANNSDGLWGCDTEYFELNGGLGDPRISFNHTISGVCSSAFSAYSDDFDEDGVKEIALGAMCDNASLWIMDNCSSAACLQNWSAPRWVADTDFSGGVDKDRFVWWIKMVDMGGSEGVKNEVCLGNGGIANSWTRCYLYNQTSKWYDENYTFSTGDADHFNGQPCDVNGDGKAELIMTQYTTAGWYVIHNYTETAPTFYGFGGGLGSNAIHCEDINGDGRKDSLTSNNGGTFRYLYWNGSAYLSVGLAGGVWNTNTVFRNDESYYCDWDSDGTKELLIQNPYSTLNAYNITNFNTTSMVNMTQVLPQSTFVTRGGGVILEGQSACQVAANYPSSGNGTRGALYYNISTLEYFFIGFPVVGNNNWAMDSNFLDIDNDSYSEVIMHQRSIDGTTADTKMVMALDFSNAYDSTPPSITIYSPLATAYGTQSIYINVSADEAIDTWWYSLNGGSDQPFTPNTTALFINGTNNLTVFANDTLGNIGFSSVSFVVNIPAVSYLISPNDLYNLSSPYGLPQPVSFNCTGMNDVNLTNITLYIGNILNETAAASGIWDFATFNKTFNVGNHNWTCQACDVFDACSFAVPTRLFSIYDARPPNITIYSPETLTYNNLTQLLQASADEAIDSWWYSINGGADSPFTPNSTVPSAEGLNNLTVFANDTAGNIGFTSMSFTVDTSLPSLAIISPANITYHTDTVMLNISAGNHSAVWFSFDASLNTSYNATIFIMNLTDGSHLVFAWANNTFGDEVQDSVAFTVDTTIPNPYDMSAARLLAELILLLFSIALLINIAKNALSKMAITSDELLQLGVLTIVMAALIVIVAGII